MDLMLWDAQDHGVLLLSINEPYVEEHVIKRERGSALVIALMLVLTFTALSLYMINSAKLQANLKLQDKAQKDIEAAVVKITALLQNPAHCNANFYNKAQSGSLTSLKKCNAGFDCRTGGTPTLYFDVNGSAFLLAQDGAKSDNAKILSATYTVTPSELVAPLKPAVLKLDIVFLKNLGKANGATHTASTVAYSFYANVITGTYNYATGVYTPSSPAIILGCARSSGSLSPF